MWNFLLAKINVSRVCNYWNIQLFKTTYSTIEYQCGWPKNMRLSKYWIYCLLLLVQQVKSSKYHPSLEKVSYNELDICVLIIHYNIMNYQHTFIQFIYYRVTPQNVGCVIETVLHMIIELLSLLVSVISYFSVAPPW